VQPEEVIFVVSGVPAGYQGNIPPVKTELQVRVMFYEESRNQAENKNSGAALASYDLILFFDVDDVIYPWAFSSVKQAYAEQDSVSAMFFSHQHFSEQYLQKKGWYSGSSVRPTPFCTINSKRSCDIVLRKMKKFSSRQAFAPFCESSRNPCYKNELFSSRTLYESLFREHVVTSRNRGNYWCCLTDDRPNFAAGWLLVDRQKVLGTRFNIEFNVAEDGELISRLILAHNVLYIDVPIGYYNQDHTNPACSAVWF